MLSRLVLSDGFLILYIHAPYLASIPLPVFFSGMHSKSYSALIFVLASTTAVNAQADDAPAFGVKGAPAIRVANVQPPSIIQLCGNADITQTSIPALLLWQMQVDTFSLPSSTSICRYISHTHLLYMNGIQTELGASSVTSTIHDRSRRCKKMHPEPE